MRAARLRRSRDIAALRLEGRSLRRAAFSARVRRSERPETRLAVVAPRTLGRAVARNRARRRVREAFRRAIADAAPIAAPNATGRTVSGLDLLVTARAEAGTAAFESLRADATAVLREATS
jgi:ribonuclease P protein component